MNSPYRVQVDDQGCDACLHGRTWWVIGPDEVASSTSYGDEEEANSLRDALNAAYALGRQNVIVDPWTKFTEVSPPASTRLLVWDAEFSSMAVMYSGDPQEAVETAAAMKYSHYMLPKSLRGPPAAELPAIQPLAVEAPAPAPESPPTPPSASPDYDDDLPF